MTTRQLGLHVRVNGDGNKLNPLDAPVHDWYRFVLSYPPHLVRHYLERFGIEPGQTVLDPFCGTGTTVVESKKLGIRNVGVEATPMAHLASATKVDWSPNADGLRRHAEGIASEAAVRLAADGVCDDQASPFTNKLVRHCGRFLRKLRSCC